MRRSAVKLSFLLLAGAIINVAVAWGWCWFETVSLYSERFRKKLISEYRAAILLCDDPDTVPWPMMACRSAVSDHAHFRIANSWRFQHRAGWPVRSVTGTHTLVAREWLDQSPPSPVNPWAALTTESAYVLQRRVLLTDDPDARTGLPMEAAIPLRPIFPGFAINTLFYAAVLWVLFAVPGRVRRWRRIKRGQCPKCAYDMRGASQASQTCPECGAQQNARRSP